MWIALLWTENIPYQMTVCCTAKIPIANTNTNTKCTRKSLGCIGTRFVFGPIFSFVHQFTFGVVLYLMLSSLQCCRYIFCLRRVFLTDILPYYTDEHFNFILYIWKLISEVFASFCIYYVLISTDGGFMLYESYSVEFLLPSPDFMLLAYFCSPLQMEVLCWKMKVNLRGFLMECILQTQTLKVQKNCCCCREGFNHCKCS